MRLDRPDLAASVWVTSNGCGAAIPTTVEEISVEPRANVETSAAVAVEVSVDWPPTPRLNTPRSPANLSSIVTSASTTLWVDLC